MKSDQTGNASLLWALPPAMGPAPKPPQTLVGVLRLLDASVEQQRHSWASTPSARAGDPLNGALRSMRTAMDELQTMDALLGEELGGRLTSAFASNVRAAFGPGALDFTRARAVGLTDPEVVTWCADVRRELNGPERQALLGYICTCRFWGQVLDGTIGSGMVDPDWDMTSARGVPASAPEARLADALTRAGLPVQTQVGVSRTGGRRRGGWFKAFWLDCAHRDIAFLLRFDVELDGAHHRNPAQRQRDSARNTLLQIRGWYILRFDGRLLRRDPELRRAVQSVAHLARRHRRALVLARTNLDSLAHGLGVPQADSLERTWEEQWRTKVTARIVHLRGQLELAVLLDDL